MKLIPPRIELKPAKCKLKIKQSTAVFPLPTKLLNGGYKVHPVPAPEPTRTDIKK